MRLHRITIVVIIMVFSLQLLAQEHSFPEFIKDCQLEVGTWIADNVEFKSELEPYEAYGMEWKWGLGRKSLTGRLYAIKDGKDIGSLFQFRRYWDAAAKKDMVIQFGSDGSYGSGEIKIIEVNEGLKSQQLVQVFTNPDGSQYKNAHKTNYLSNSERIGKSYSIDNSGTWTHGRTYKWVKKINTSSNSVLDKLGFLQGKWKATAVDTSFTSVLEYQWSPEKRLLMASNHLYGKDGQQFASYEGAYLVEDGTILYIIAGPNGETHRGEAIASDNTITHMANIYPGKGVKSYRSEMVLKDGKLLYYANYSKESNIPEDLVYEDPLIYIRN